MDHDNCEKTHRVIRCTISNVSADAPQGSEQKFLVLLQHLGPFPVIGFPQEQVLDGSVFLHVDGYDVTSGVVQLRSRLELDDVIGHGPSSNRLFD